MTLIAQETATFFTLTTEKGTEIGVNLNPWGTVSIYIQAKGRKSLPAGKQFKNLGEAAKAYKSAEIKTALRALMEA